MIAYIEFVETILKKISTIYGVDLTKISFDNEYVNQRQNVINSVKNEL